MGKSYGWSIEDGPSQKMGVQIFFLKPMAISMRCPFMIQKAPDSSFKTYLSFSNDSIGSL